MGKGQLDSHFIGIKLGIGNEQKENTSKGQCFLPLLLVREGGMVRSKSLVCMSFVFLCFTAGVISHNTTGLDVCVHLAFPLL